MRKKLLGLIIVLCSSFAFGDVWRTSYEWSPAYEDKYRSWLKNIFNKNFFASKLIALDEKNDSNKVLNPFYGLHVDCADTVYSARIIFSYLNELPFAINDPSGGDTALITNEMTRWDLLNSQDLRVKKFLLYIYNIVSTKSIPKDTYPVALNTVSIHSGNIILTTEKNHHSWTIKSILAIGLPHLIYNSTVGAYSGLGLQERISWPNGEWVFEANHTPSGNAGIRAWRKISELKLPVWKVTGYSEDQYSVKPSQWKIKLQKILQKKEETNEQKIHRILENVCSDVSQREDAVKEAFEFNKINGFSCMSTEDYENYSTPSRDRRLADEIINLRNEYQAIRNSQQVHTLENVTVLQLNKVFPNPDLNIKEESFKQKTLSSDEIVDEFSVCKVQYFSISESTTKIIDLAELKRRLFIQKLSSDPNDPPEIRFGDDSANIRRNRNHCL